LYLTESGNAITPQDIKEMGKMWGSSLFTPEDFRNLLQINNLRSFFWCWKIVSKREKRTPHPDIAGKIKITDDIFGGFLYLPTFLILEVKQPSILD
jgi:hypothetical protein